MSRARWVRLAWFGLLILALLLLVRQHGASGAELRLAAGSATRGERLAEGWCGDCHAIEPRATLGRSAAPDFTAIANQPGTTELMLKVFLRTSHATMPNFIIQPDDADDLAQYILSLRR